MWVHCTAKSNSDRLHISCFFHPSYAPRRVPRSSSTLAPSLLCHRSTTPSTSQSPQTHISTLHSRTGAHPPRLNGRPNDLNRFEISRLFRHSPLDKPLLLIYRDDPCVVIGRNQNPWKEVNFSALKRTGIPFIRRRSGGGTVYHVRISLHISESLVTWKCTSIEGVIGSREHEFLDTSAAGVV